MLRTYKGRYEYGKLVLQRPEQDLIPDTANIIITFLDDETITHKHQANEEKLSPIQQNAAQNFLLAMQNLRKEGFSPEDEAAINDLQSGKYKPKFEERLKI